MSRNELDDILRSHFRDELAGQRGRALEAFEQQVTRPMQMRLSQPAIALRWRQWSVAACTMAACVAVGFVLPKILTAGGEAATGATASSGTKIIEPEFAALERTTMWNNVDVGPVMLDSETPGRKIRQQRIDQYRWVDPQTSAHMEYSAPSEHEVLLETGRQ